jgi:hypothetical protein
MEGATGLEPAASCVTGRSSDQLNYAPRIVSSNPFLFPPMPSRSLSYHLAVPRQGNNDVQLIGFQR